MRRKKKQGGTNTRPQARDLDAIPAVRERNIGQVDLSAKNASSLNQLLDRGPRNTTFLGHNFRVLASNFKPGKEMGALDVFFGESHRSSWSIQI